MQKRDNIAEEIYDDYVLEWSHTQKMFHVERIQWAVDNNMDALRENRSNDYIPIAHSLTHEQAHALADQLRASAIPSMVELRENLDRIGL